MIDTVIAELKRATPEVPSSEIPVATASRALVAFGADGKEAVQIDPQKLADGDTTHKAAVRALIGAEGAPDYSADIDTFLASANNAAARTSLGVGLTGKTLWVDGANGNDATGTSGRQDLPYLTLAAAKTAAASGDLIHVRPGTYNEKNLLKNGVNWHFEAGANVLSTSISDGGIFDDGEFGANGAVTSIIGGYGSFALQYTEPNTTGKTNTITLVNAASNVTIFANNIQDLRTGSGINAIRHAGGALNVNARKISGSIGAIWWSSGESYIKCEELVITGAGSSVYSSPGATALAYYTEDYTSGFLWIQAQRIVGACTLQGPLLTPRIWINAQEITGNINASGSLNYVIAMKLAGTVNVSGATGNHWFTIQKITGSATGYAAILNHTATVHLDVQQIEHAGLQAAIRCSAGTNYIRVMSCVPSSNVNAFRILAGVTRLSGYFDTSAASTRDAIRVEDGTLFLDDCKIISHASRVDIAHEGGTVNVTGGHGSDTGGGFRTSGTVNYLYPWPDVDVTGVYKVDGVQVVGPQGAPIATVDIVGDTAGPDTVDITVVTDALNAHQGVLNEIITVLRAHGLIETP